MPRHWNSSNSVISPSDPRRLGPATISPRDLLKYTHPVGVTRRDFLRSATAISVGALAGVGAYGVAYERHRISCIVRDVAVRGLPQALSGVRIGMITDVHHSAVVSAGDVTHAVQLLTDAAPDIVVLGGDYVSFFDRSYI